MGSYAKGGSTCAFSKLKIALIALVVVIVVVAVVVGSVCGTGHCKKSSSSPPKPIAYDLRIAPAFATRTGTQIRVSVIGDASLEPPKGFADSFSYAAPFKYRWNQFALYTKMMNVTSGNNTIDVGGMFNVTVKVPTTTDTVRGLMIGDPCISSKFINCKYGQEFDNRLSRLINLFSDMNAIDFYSILGDNFYDRDGTITPNFFESLNMNAKSKLLLTVPGNHDYWVYAHPGEQFLDQYGHGFMQYYGQDVMASVKQFPYNFAVDPDKVNPADSPDARLAPFDDFFFYNHIGPVGTIGFSGGHTWEEVKPHMVEACQHFIDTDTPWVILMGHWDENRSGVKPNMTVEDAHKLMIDLPPCSQLGDHRLKFFEGHRHCNWIIKPNTGFMVGAFGMERCGDFGVPYLEASATNIQLTYFSVKVNDTEVQPFEDLMTCFSTNGIENCKHMGQVWMNDNITPTP